MLIFGLLLVSVGGYALAAQLPDPGHLALVLGEEEYDNYLDKWLAIEEPKWTRAVSARCTEAPTAGCELRVNGDLGQPQPVYLRNGKFIEPTGSSGSIHLEVGEEVVVACTGSGRTIRHDNMDDVTISTATAVCLHDNLVSGEGWLLGASEFVGLVCSSNAQFEARATDRSCYAGNLVIEAGFDVEGTWHPVYETCFDQSRLEVLYSHYTLTPQNSVHQTSVTRPGWLVSTFFPGVGINSRYTQAHQRDVFDELVGEELSAKYLTTQQYLARGHLAAKTDFVLATGQRSTFFFINAAPQWQPFNGGNWNWLEQNSRARIAAADYDTVVYTGTFGVSQVRNQSGQLVDLYLYKDANNNDQLPVPKYFYKVIYDESRKIGTAFISINNPYYTEEEVQDMVFCTDRCRNNSDFSWLNWQPDRIDIGYSFCCEVDDFRNTIPHLNDINIDTSNGLLF